VITKQATEIANLTTKIKDLTQKRFKAQELFGQNELYQNFKKLMDEKDKII
jgi:hypothetical protein